MLRGLSHAPRFLSEVLPHSRQGMLAEYEAMNDRLNQQLVQLKVGHQPRWKTPAESNQRRGVAFLRTVCMRSPVVLVLVCRTSL